LLLLTVVIPAAPLPPPPPPIRSPVVDVLPVAPAAPGGVVICAADCVAKNAAATTRHTLNKRVDIASSLSRQHMPVEMKLGP
jgi:hypothetical protein